MAHLHFDSFGGASGDMILASLLDLGISKNAIEETLTGLGLGPFRIEVHEETDHGIRGLRIDIIPPDERPDLLSSLVRAAGSLFSSRSPAKMPSPHRGWHEIEKLIRNADLPARVREDSLRVFQRLAEVEAHIHGTRPEKVHFHEVGALDAIADIVGATLARYLLNVERVTVGPLPVGHGVVASAHGPLPLPAPATAEILRNMPTVPFEETGETVTPTGAALLSVWKTSDTRPAGRWIRIGHGLGQRRWKTRPNLLRAFLMETDLNGACENGDSADVCLVLDCQIDDQTPEQLGALSGRLLAAGALDVFMTPVFMKKQRPGVRLTVLARPEEGERFRDLLFRESTTLGIRERLEVRSVLPRRIETVTTPYGDVRIKLGFWKGEIVNASPEFADCEALARKSGVPVKEIMAAALTIYRTRSAP